ncbi:copper resistance CopC/CopD family protein [Streptomyces sp. NPDC020490]|uniref:copper resistance CopC/CopD family protein n=1 Tax=Streptomyces sp. NPDC020490 TaxID=3365078 RepID=UPI0037B47D17
MLLGALLLLLVLGGAVPASAHAALRSTDPADGTVLDSAPRHVTLAFTESVGLLDDSVRVLDPGNRRVRTGGAQHGPGGSDTVRVPLPAGLSEGTYVVAWRVVSADSHPVSGAFTFSVGRPSATTAPVDTGPVEDPVTGSLFTVARYLAYLAAALLIGTAAFVALCRPPERGALRRPLTAGWWTLLAATLALLVLRGPYETGAGPSAALDPSALARTLTGRPGLALLARLALLLVAAAVWARWLRGRGAWSRPALAAGAVLAVGLALTWASAEHASAGIQVPAAMASSVLHLLAMAVWLGGLTALLRTLHRDRVPAAVVARFSRIAFACVTVLVITGVYQSWRGLGSWDQFTGTAYGRLLTAKLAAVALLLAAAGLSRRATALLPAARAEAAVPERVSEPVGGPPPLVSLASLPSLPPEPAEAAEASEAAEEASGDDHRRVLRHRVLAEVAVGLVVLVITTVLTGTLPGRAEAEAARGPATTAGGLPVASVTTVPFDVGTPGGRGKVQITLDPGRVGGNSVQAVVYGPDGGISTVPELRMSLTLPARGIGPVDARLTDRGGYWGTGSLTLPLAGTWTMRVTVRVSDVDQVTVTKPVRITG